MLNEQEKSIFKNDKRTIDDFGEQWTRYQTNDGYYASKELFIDICGPLLPQNEIKGCKVADIGSGTGRIVNMLLDAEIQHVVAIEPSKAFEVLKKNTQNNSHKIEYLNATGDKIPADRNLDYVFSIGVLHHISEPGPIVKAAYNALRPGGKILIWLYGYEGNEAYLRLMQPLRKITTSLPHFLLAGLCYFANLVLDIYIFLCKYFNLPMRAYINKVLAKLTREKRHLVIYDQLNPAVAKYYRESEARKLLENAGFKNIKLYHRHGYSWTVIGTKI